MSIPVVTTTVIAFLTSVIASHALLEKLDHRHRNNHKQHPNTHAKLER